MCVLSCIWLCNPMDCVAHQANLFMEFSRQEYWSVLPFLSPGTSSQPRDRTHVSCIILHWQADSLSQSQLGIPNTSRYNSFNRLMVCEYFPQLWAFHLNFLIVLFFWRAKCLILRKSNLLSLSFMAKAFFVLGNVCLPQTHKDFLLCFLPNIWQTT